MKEGEKYAEQSEPCISQPEGPGADRVGHTGNQQPIQSVNSSGEACLQAWPGAVPFSGSRGGTEGTSAELAPERLSAGTGTSGPSRSRR